MGSTSSQTTSSAASSSSPASWDVFLSFRGTDTRNSFTSHLYTALECQGIRTFMDNSELRSGEVISEALLEAIRESKSYIVVFSKNYASSPWCLEELVEIYNSHKTKARLVIPVFCNIDPRVVRHQIESFKEAFEKHESRFSSQAEKLNKWRHALTEVANISGQVSQNRSEAYIIHEIVEILLKKYPKILNVAKYPVGLDSRIRDITTLLSTSTEGVITFGIYGMGGVGKTTLAKALYNQLLLGSFQDSCFLANCSEVSRTTKGLESLQQKLINDVLKSNNEVMVDNADNGIQLIKERICLRKLLVVIDDLDQYLKIEYLIGQLSKRPIFAPGSIVIITTRREDLLEKIIVDRRYRCKVNELNKDMSRTLFTKHAFGNENAERSRTLMVLAEKILHHAGGLPLALEVFGTSLYNEPEAGWEYLINKLQRISDTTIQQSLMISLDGLSDDPMLKNMFLDIACFLIGSVKERAVKLLETYYSDADYSISILEKRCLLDIYSNKLRMHDLLRDMGREVSRNNSPNDPGKHSRLWKVEDICDVLMRRKGTKKIEGIIPWNQKSMKGISFTSKTFKRLSNLRFLFLKDVKITGSFEQTPEDLRWLSWYECPLENFPSEFYPEKLVFLALPDSKLKTIKVFKNLKNLVMSGSVDLTTTPDFTKLPCLETLNLSYCRSLKEVNISNGNLKKLVYLNLEGCVQLKCLPNTLCNLGALEILNINGCWSLKALPVELGNIKSLKKLSASFLKVSKLPESIGCLCRLVELFLSVNYELETFPDTICNLGALEVLNINWCRSLRALPVELGKMESLKELSMEGLNVSEIPNSIGNLHELAILDLAYCENLRNLPDSIGSLRSPQHWPQETIPIKYWVVKKGVYLRPYERTPVLDTEFEWDLFGNLAKNF